MANLVKVSLKAEANVSIALEEFKIEDIDDSAISVYIGCNEVSCLVGKIDYVRELNDLVGPNNLIQTMRDSCNEYEYDCLWSALWSRNYEYLFINRLLKAKNYIERC